MLRWTLFVAGAALLRAQPALPPEPQAVRFAVIGDMGTGRKGQYQLAEEMVQCHREFPFDFVLTLGDNIYGGHNPADYRKKFEIPYRQLLEGGVNFYASLGNHDNLGQLVYRPFHMEGNRYYCFKKGPAEFFALDSTRMDARQLGWLSTQLRESDSTWKICYFHHPLYSDGTFHHPSVALREILEPVLREYGVQVVFSGHEHVYERIKPRDGINYFIVGSSGQLRLHNLRPSEEMAKGFDTDRAFLLGEVAGGRLYFRTVSRAGKTVDSGMFVAHDTAIAAR
jgi:predicted MPP superfamily phosphohydrolase